MFFIDVFSFVIDIQLTVTIMTVYFLLIYCVSQFKTLETISMQIPAQSELLQHCLEAGQSFPFEQRKELSTQAFRASGLDGSGQPVGEITKKATFQKELYLRYLQLQQLLW